MSVQSPRLNLPLGVDDGYSPLHKTLASAARRIRALRLLRCLSLALLVGALTALVLVGLSKLRLYETPAPLAMGSLIWISLLISALIALLPKLPDLEVARLTERRADLKERLSSAVEFRNQGPHQGEPFFGEQMQDAVRHAQDLDLKRLYPVRMPRTLPFALIATLSLFLIYYLPGLPIFWSRHHKAEMAEVHARGIEILKLAKNTQKVADQQKLIETRKAAVEMQKLGEAMRKGKLGKKEALVAQQKLTRRMEEQQRQLADRAAPKSLEEAAKKFKKSMDQMQRELSQAQQKKKVEQPANAKQPQKPGQKAAADTQKESETMKQAKAAIKQMQEAMAKQDPKQMQAAMQKMAEAMQKGKLSKQEMKQMAQALQQMAQALKDTQMKASAQQMQQAAQMMQSMNGMDSKSMQKMAEMMKRIGEGMGKPSGQALAALDAKALGNLLQQFKEGRMTMAGNQPGFGHGRGGQGYGGRGHATKAMKDPGETKPRLIVGNGDHATKAAGKSGSLVEFQKYLAQSNGKSAHAPNGKIKGSKSANGQELSTTMTGDPSPAQSSSPYYQAVETSRKQAESALNKENIPASMKKQVHDYFDSIKP